MSQGCVQLTTSFMVVLGWHLTTEGCDGSGILTAGHRWCLVQDFSAEPIRRPYSSTVRTSAKDALMMACHRTLGANSERIVDFFAKQGGTTKAKQRNERL